MNVLTLRLARTSIQQAYFRQKAQRKYATEEFVIRQIEKGNVYCIRTQAALEYSARQTIERKFKLTWPQLCKIASDVDKNHSPRGTFYLEQMMKQLHPG